MTLFRGPLSVLRKSLRPFLMVNLAYFGLVCAGMATVRGIVPPQEAIRGELKVEVPEKLPSIYDAYLGGHLWKAIGLTFFVNLVVGSILYMAVPSLVIPTAVWCWEGLPLVLGSTLFAKLCHIKRCRLITRGLTGVLIVLEGEGYALAMLGSYVHGKSWLCAGVSAGATTRWQGYKAGARRR